MSSLAGSQPKVLVFGYGSNGVAQLRARCANPTLTLQPARLPDHARVFCLRSPRWGQGGVASVTRAPNECCLGSVAELTAAEKERLDKFEKPAYRDVAVTVEVRDGTGAYARRQAVAYVGGDGAESFTLPFTTPPSEAYLVAIRSHLKDFHENIDALDVCCAKRGYETNWRYPVRDPTRLDLASLVVEVNARRAVPWTMPAAIPPRCAALVEAGLGTTAGVAEALCEWPRAQFASISWDADGLNALAQVPLHRVFVYGSLLMGLHNAERVADANNLGAATTAAPFALRSAGPRDAYPYAYPYAVDGADAPGLATACLVGELYVCSTDQLDRLDVLEGHPTHYRRRRVKLRGDDADAWMYVLCDTDELAAIRSQPEAFADAAGDWRAFLKSLEAPLAARRDSVPCVAEEEPVAARSGFTGVDTLC